MSAEEKKEELNQILKMLREEESSGETYEYYKMTTGDVFKYRRETGQFFRLNPQKKQWEEHPELATVYFDNYQMDKRLQDFDDSFPIEEETEEKTKS